MKNEDAFMMMITRYILLANIKAGSYLLRWVLSKNIPSMFMHIPSSEQLLDSAEREQELNSDGLNF